MANNFSSIHQPVKRTPRGRKKYTLTIEDIAMLCKITVHAVRKAQQMGELDMNDINSRFEFIAKRRKLGQNSTHKTL